MIGRLGGPGSRTRLTGRRGDGQSGGGPAVARSVAVAVHYLSPVRYKGGIVIGSDPVLLVCRIVGRRPVVGVEAVRRFLVGLVQAEEVGGEELVGRDLRGHYAVFEQGVLGLPAQVQLHPVHAIRTPAPRAAAAAAFTTTAPVAAAVTATAAAPSTAAIVVLTSLLLSSPCCCSCCVMVTNVLLLKLCDQQRPDVAVTSVSRDAAVQYYH